MSKKSMWILGSIVAILFIIVLIISAKILFYPSGKGVYGNRLDGIENYPITNEKIEQIKKFVIDTKYCEAITYRLQGKIMKFFINVKDETSSTNVQSLGNKIIDAFSETELSYYDIAIYINSSSNQEPYPMMGYKSKSNNVIVWTTNKGDNDEK